SRCVKVGLIYSTRQHQAAPGLAPGDQPRLERILQVAVLRQDPDREAVLPTRPARDRPLVHPARAVLLAVRAHHRRLRTRDLAEVIDDAVEQLYLHVLGRERPEVYLRLDRQLAA